MRQKLGRSTTLVAVALSVGLLSAQTPVTPPDNKYTPEEDVRLGREAAAEAERQLPLLRDDNVTSYVERLGERLVAVIPADLQQPEFEYTFKVMNVRDINAFALPGGPMYLNRGMIEAARTEGEMVSVMAHELSHVILRHGTAQASKATKYGLGQLAGAVLGAIIGGNVGTIVSQGTQFGLGAAFLRFGREYERQADLLGSQLMARAGYDPVDMARMFETIEKEGGSNGPEWLSSHPNPSNRREYITEEARALQVTNPIHDTQGFERVQARLKELPRAPTTEEATRNASRSGRNGGGSGAAAPPTGRVQPPSGRYTRYNEGDLFEVSVPSNWRELADSDSVTFSPEGGYGSYNGASVFTHGMQIGLARNETHDLQTATDELVEAFARGNRNLQRTSGYERVSVDGRRALRTTLRNVNEATGDPETIQLVTTELGNGNLLYSIGVAPTGSFGSYRSVFNRIVGSIQIRG
jgi:Zn-dependent protease with chaperone function